MRSNERRETAGCPQIRQGDPGHGDDSTIGAERPHLDEWRRRGW